MAGAAVTILVITNDFPPRAGGIEDFVGQLLRRLPPGVRADVIGPPHADAPSFDATFPHRVSRRPRGPLVPSPGLVRAALDVAARERPDVVLFGAALPLGLMGGVLRRRLRVPIVACTHGVEPAFAGHPALRWIARAALRHAAAVTVVSDWAERRVRPVVGPATRLERLASGVDEAVFHPGVSGGDIRRRHALDPGPVVVCLARLVRRKGQDRLIRAVAPLAREFPDVRLLLAGEGPDRPRLEALARRHGVERRVVLAGRVSAPEVPAYLAAGDVFAMPCRTRLGGLDVEALGAVFLQAAAVGRPVVAGDSGGAPEAVRHGETGLVVDGRSDEAVTSALARLLRNADDARAMGARGAAWARGMTWDRRAAGLAALLRSLVR